MCRSQSLAFYQPKAVHWTKTRPSDSGLGRTSCGWVGMFLRFIRPEKLDRQRLHNTGRRSPLVIFPPWVLQLEGVGPTRLEFERALSICA